VITISVTVQCLQNEPQLFQIKIRLAIKYFQVQTNKKINSFWMHQENNSIIFAISKLHLTAEVALAVSASVSGTAHWLLTAFAVSTSVSGTAHWLLTALAVCASVSGAAHWLLTLRTAHCVFQ
jgi:hypothetical protein